MATYFGSCICTFSVLSTVHLKCWLKLLQHVFIYFNQFACSIVSFYGVAMGVVYSRCRNLFPVITSWLSGSVNCIGWFCEPVCNFISTYTCATRHKHRLHNIKTTVISTSMPFIPFSCWTNVAILESAVSTISVHASLPLLSCVTPYSHESLQEALISIKTSCSYRHHVQLIDFLQSYWLPFEDIKEQSVSALLLLTPGQIPPILAETDQYET